MSQFQLSQWQQFDEQLAGLTLQISGVQSDSRLIQAGNLFVALVGEQVDGMDFVHKAQQLGAVAVITNSQKKVQAQIPVFYSANVLQWLPQALLQITQLPLPLIGVTGTNGKTSITHYLAQALQYLKQPCALIGTAGNGCPDNLVQSKNTTPDLVSFHALLHDYAQHFACCAVEVSSHGIALNRIGDVTFSDKVFTNITQDHLDFHGSFAEYFAVKRQWFLQGDGNKILNLDDVELATMAQQHDIKNLITYSVHNQDADLFASDITQSLGHITFYLHIQQQPKQLVRLALLGEFNLSNALACAAVLSAQQFSAADIAMALGQLKPVLGRMQFTAIAGRVIVVDYAHTHDALEKALLALHHQQPSALKVVFGCGGDRDKGKRPLMAKVAQQYCQQVYITDDNPRTEDNQQILADIAQGFSAEYVTSQVTVIADREQAIKQAMADLKTGECLLIAGKGHETYQEIQHQRFHFSDTEKVEQFKGLIA